MVNCFLTGDDVVHSGKRTLVTNVSLLQTHYGTHHCDPSARATVGPLQLRRWVLEREATSVPGSQAHRHGPFLEQSCALKIYGVARPQALARETAQGLQYWVQCYGSGWHGKYRE